VVIPKFSVPLLLNTLDANISVRFEKWFHESLSLDAEWLNGRTVIKKGISTGLTSGVIVDVSSDSFIVLGSEVTPFAVPGDSGSLVVDTTGLILGIVAEIEYLLQAGHGVYCTKVVPMWMFHDWLLEEVLNMVYSQNCG
jgi:hypothetical protein